MFEGSVPNSCGAFLSCEENVATGVHARFVDRPGLGGGFMFDAASSAAAVRGHDDRLVDSHAVSAKCLAQYEIHRDLARAWQADS